MIRLYCLRFFFGFHFTQGTWRFRGFINATRSCICIWNISCVNLWGGLCLGLIYIKFAFPFNSAENKQSAPIGPMFRKVSHSLSHCCTLTSCSRPVQCSFATLQAQASSILGKKLFYFIFVVFMLQDYCLRAVILIAQTVFSGASFVRNFFAVDVWLAKAFVVSAEDWISATTSLTLKIISLVDGEKKKRSHFGQHWTISRFVNCEL